MLLIIKTNNCKRSNWIEIERKNEYVQRLQVLLETHKISYPPDLYSLQGLAKARPLSSPFKFVLMKKAQELCYFSNLPLNKFGKLARTLISLLFIQYSTTVI